MNVPVFMTNDLQVRVFLFLITGADKDMNIRCVGRDFGLPDHLMAIIRNKARYIIIELKH